MQRLAICVFALALAAGLAPGAECVPLEPPEGAVVLFDGVGSKDLSQWQRARLDDEGRLLAGVTSKAKFADAVIHLEFIIPPAPEGRRAHGNSGVYIQRRYEIQILNSHGGKPRSGGCGAIYRYKAADTNAALEPGTWQSYTIFFREPDWAEREGKPEKTADARFTVFHNGVKIHDRVEVSRKTGHGRPEGPEPGPLHLQHHGWPVAFRNVWVLPVEDEAAERTAAGLLEKLESGGT
ncbi:MAG: DUF1080 domain-containing protein [Candidatus Brocadiia bacterium]